MGGDDDAGTAGGQPDPGDGTAPDPAREAIPDPDGPDPDERFRLPLAAVRPSQLYLSGPKLRAVLEWFEFDRPGTCYDPLPVFRYEGEWYLSDGHTRAFAAHLAGADALRVRRDVAVRESDDLDFDLYRECIGWCRDAGVTGVSDFAGRVLSEAAFEREWLDRCDRAAERLGGG